MIYLRPPILSQSAGVLAWMFSRHLGIRVDRLARSTTTTTALGGSNFDHPQRLPRRGRHGFLYDGSVPRGCLSPLSASAAADGDGTVTMSQAEAVGLEEDGDGGGGGEGEGEGEMSMVQSISPSAVAAFKQCPKLFFYRHILGLKSSATLESLKGIAVHEVLSRFFTLEEDSRDLVHLHEQFREVMTELILQDNEDKGYRKLFSNREQEQRWAVECLDLLANFTVAERENASEGDPLHVELKMKHTFGERGEGDKLGARDPGGAADAATSIAAAAEGGGGGGGLGDGGEDAAPGMSVTGIVDRLDRCLNGKLRVVDYKTGKIPNLKYPPAVNARIMDDQFFQLKIYALLVERVLGEVPGEMRLVYLKGPKSVTRAVDMSDLPSTQKELQDAWDEISASVQQGSFPTRTGVLCDWCSFKNRCPAFAEEREGGSWGEV